MLDKISISLVIPSYNEKANIQKGVLDKIGNYTRRNEKFSEVLLIDDGSTDSSIKLIKEKYLSQYPKFKLVENEHQGKGFSIIDGVKLAKGKYVMFSDIDLATPIEESEKLIEAIKEGYFVVVGSRNRQRTGAPFLRKVMAVGYIIIRDFIIGLKDVKDTQCGFKIFQKKAALKIIDKLKVFHDKKRAVGSSVAAGFDLEFLFIATRLGYKIKEVPVTWLHVETKNVNFLRDSLETIIDILKIKYFDLLHKYV